MDSDILKFHFPTSNCFDILLKNLQNGTSCSKFAYFSFIPYKTDSSFLDGFGPNLVQGLISGANSKSEVVLWIKG